MTRELFSLHATDESVNNWQRVNGMAYQGLWLPTEGLVNAIDVPEVETTEQIAGWWTGRIALNRLTKIVPADIDEVTVSDEAIALLEPLFRDIVADSGDRFRNGYPRNNKLRSTMRTPEHLYPSEHTLAEALGVERVETLYGQDGMLFGPVLSIYPGAQGESVISVDPYSPAGLITRLGTEVAA